MSWTELGLIVPFAGFLAGRLNLTRIEIVADDVERAHVPQVAGLEIDVIEPRRAPDIGPDVLPVIIAPWSNGTILSASGRALLALRDRHQLIVLVEPLGVDPSVDPLAGLRNRLERSNLEAPLIGVVSSQDGSPIGSIALVESPAQPLSPVVEVPDDFTVVAFMMTYNEIDILAKSVEDMWEQGVGVYIVDNWSTDGTYELGKSLLGREVVGIERSPAEGPPRYYDYRSILGRIEELSSQVRADWFIKSDADEIRRGPWEGDTLREAIYRVDRAGYNRIDFTIVNFQPVDNDFVPGSNFVDYFPFFDFGHNPGHFVQQKAWKDLGQEVSIAASAGHVMEFPGSRVFPYKFLVRHYPIRSQTHGERKVFSERQKRILPAARERGWHNHYDRYQFGETFLADPESIHRFDDDFHSRHFIERLSGMGIERLTPQKRKLV